jgi:hypothetical protein
MRPRSTRKCLCWTPTCVFIHILAALFFFFVCVCVCVCVGFLILFNAIYSSNLAKGVKRVMGQLLNLVQATFFLNKFSFYDRPKLFRQKSCSYVGNYAQLQMYQGLQLPLQGHRTCTNGLACNFFSHVTLVKCGLLLTGVVVGRVDSLFKCKVLIILPSFLL